MSESQKAEARKGKAKMSNNWQRRLKNNTDADVEVLAQKTWRVEDVVADAADAAPEQVNILLDAREQSMNSFVQSKTEKCSRRLKSHSDHCVWSKSWSCAYSRMS